MRILLLVSFVFIFSGCQTLPKCGPEIRAAFDVGSGSTKLKVAELNTCDQTLTKVLHEEQTKVDYRDALEKNEDRIFSPEIQKTGIDAILHLKKVAESKGARKFSAVATAAFRQALNGEDFSHQIYLKTDIPVRVISQDQEAILGFQSATLKYDKKDFALIVWDIGGGSQQMTILDINQKPIIYYGNLASVSFKNKVIKDIQKKNIEKVISPNPMSKEQTAKAKKMAKDEAQLSVPAIITHTLKEKKNLTVIGIGGVLTKSLPRQVSSKNSDASSYQTISKSEVLAALESRRKLTDKQLKDPFADTDVTNLALVSGFMEALGIENYQPLDVSLMDGLWFNPEYFQP